MTIAILTFLSALLPFLLWLANRRARKTDSPIDQALKARRAIEKEVANDDETAANIRLNDTLAKFRLRQNHPNLQRPAGSQDESRKGHDSNS